MTVDIPHYFPCRLDSDSGDCGANFACLALPIDGGAQALMMFSTRELAQAFIEESGDDFKGWIVAYIGYDLMGEWLQRAVKISSADLIVIDVRASGLHPTQVTGIGNVLYVLDTQDTESGEPLAVDVETYSL